MYEVISNGHASFKIYALECELTELAHEKSTHQRNQMRRLLPPRQLFRQGCKTFRRTVIGAIQLSPIAQAAR